MHYYRWHIAEWALHTSHLTLEEEGIYRRLLDHYFYTESPIPKKTQPVIRRLRLVSYENKVGQILAEFFVLESDGYHHLRADLEIKAYHDKGRVARENGRKGGRPPKNRGLKTKPVILANPDKTKPVILANPDVTQKKPPHKLTKNYKLRTNNQELIKSIDQATLDALFERFWNSGLRKIKKNQARPLFEKAVKNSELEPETFTDQLVLDIQQRLEGNQFGFSNLHPTNYLNHERWTDEVISDDSIRPGAQPGADTALPPRKPTPEERVKIKREEARQRELARQPYPVGVVGEDDGHVRPPVGFSARGQPK